MSLDIAMWPKATEFTNFEFSFTVLISDMDNAASDCA